MMEYKHMFTTGSLLAFLIATAVTAQSNNNDKTAYFRSLGKLCGWAQCQDLCQYRDEIVSPYDYYNSRCSASRYNEDVYEADVCNEAICITHRPYSGRPCLANSKTRTVCYSLYRNESTNRVQTRICWDQSPRCMDLANFCKGQRNVLCTSYRLASTTTIGWNTSPSPLDSTDQKRKGPPLTTEGYATTGFANDKLKLIDSLAMAIIVAVGAFLVTLLVVIFCLCLTRRRRRKRALRSPYIEEFPMNQIPVYQAVGPALPPNHPTLRMGVGSTSMDVGTYQPILPETDRTKTTLGVSQVDDTTSTEGKNQSGHQLSQKYQKDTKRSNSLVMVKDYQTINKSYTELSSGDSTTAVQGPAYAVLEEGDTDPTHQAKTEGTDTDVVDNNYTALNVETMTDNEEAPPQDGKDVERGEVRHELNEDLVMNVPNGIATDGVESTRPKQLELETEPFRLKFTEVDTKTEYDRGSSTLRAGEQLQSEERQANDDRNVMTFPRQRGQSHHGVSPVQTGAETPSKFSFRSLRLGSKKKMKKSRKKKGSIEGELCLDVKISSPSPTEETAPSIFSAAVPLEQVEIKKMQPQEQVETETLQPPRTLQPLSKSQEALFDDAFEEPFRNRSCSQPMKQTFSPTLSKEYAEIRESWGATYIQNFKVIAESKQE